MNLTKLDHAPRDISPENKSAVKRLEMVIDLKNPLPEITWYFCRQDNDYYVKIHNRVFRVARQSQEPLEEVENIKI